MISCKRVWDLRVKVLETSSSKGRKASLLKGRGAWTPYQPGLEIRCSVGPETAWVKKLVCGLGWCSIKVQFQDAYRDMPMTLF